MARTLAFWCLWPAIAVVVWGELTPHPPAFTAHVWDKSEHFTAYFGLSLMASLFWGARRSLVWVMLALVALGGALEILQGFTGRDPDIFDELANSIGAVSGLLVALALLWFDRDPLVEGARRD